MPAPKPLDQQHIHDYRPRFTEEVHGQILQLTAELTRLNGNEPVPKNVVLRALAERQISRLRPSDLNEILTAIHCD
ncbi:hypothetical protein EBI00_02395 [Marinomonas hwangdonensis]|uniref:Uncharacterized protein n=1 Tax=Marinomonas hwangdonensis TaxID=1053647 RepID=A0A3M8QDZ8_9GAMM|nr:hypothetical protein [Marinomonas hwangdonensis]RNF52970.1 hypothetical protein EBI00_02395 [Marinomonas hwangdonensis]